jgi:ABC-type polysaccharide/polyol phosphate transport system ATPase subunit
MLDDVSVSFPILHAGQRSLKKRIMATTTGGVIMHEARSIPIVQALKNVSVRLGPGDRIGLVGPNGAGKSTFLRVVAGIYEPNGGWVHIEGEVMPLLDVNIGLNADLTGRQNILLRGMYLGYKPSAFAALVPEIEEFTELGDYLDLPVRTYSSGMQMRLSLSIATAVQPSILLMDEWLLAGDAAFMEKSRARLETFIEKAHILVLASHSERIIRQWCNKAIFLNAGRVETCGSVEEVLSQYRMEL